MLRKIRITLAVIFFVLLTFLFLDFTGSLHAWFGFLARIQFLPALLALNFGVVAALVALTLLFGRVYCSVICPLGVMQDIFGYFGRKARKNRYSYSSAKNCLRYGVLAAFVAAMLLGAGSAAALIAPYSAYGRIAQNLLAPVWAAGNNLLALVSERLGSYAFYSVDVWVRSGAAFAVAALTLAVLALLSWRGGRTWCNTVCPVGTVLGTLSRFSLFRPVIDTSRCNGCKLCARNCKASCIDASNHRIDYSRCVACMDCMEKCHNGAITYTFRRRIAEKTGTSAGAGTISRRSFLSLSALFAGTSLARAREKKVDGGLAALADRKIPDRSVPVVPPGASGLSRMSAHCTACQLCVAVCPNGVLRPSLSAGRFMQPEMSYERGYCRPECTKCSEVCPTGAILPVSPADKSSVQIGHAVWVRENCVPLTDGVSCGNCARHCPVGAITMVPADASDAASPKIPAVNTERCIGCGACENLCPARPFSAIYVEGHECHRTI